MLQANLYIYMTIYAMFGNHACCKVSLFKLSRNEQKPNSSKTANRAYSMWYDYWGSVKSYFADNQTHPTTLRSGKMSKHLFPITKKTRMLVPMWLILAWKRNFRDWGIPMFRLCINITDKWPREQVNYTFKMWWKEKKNALFQK